MLLKGILHHTKRVKIVLLLLCFSPLCFAKQIAITFDDAPRKAEGYFDGLTRANTLIAALKRHNVEQVAFFANSQRLNKEGIHRLQAYSQAGHIIANHSHSHLNFNQVNLADYVEDFLLAGTKAQIKS